MTPIADDAWGDLHPLVEKTARKVARVLNMNALTRDAFLAEAAGWILEKGDGYHAARGDLGGWCYRVLTNRGVDLIRRAATEKKALRAYGDAARREHRFASRGGGPLSEEADPPLDAVAVLETHVAGVDRLLIAIDCRLLGTLATGRAEAWLEQAGLSGDFPWREIEAIEKQADRRKALVASLCVSPGWLRKRLSRALDALAKAMGGTP